MNSSRRLVQWPALVSALLACLAVAPSRAAPLSPSLDTTPGTLNDSGLTVCLLPDGTTSSDCAGTGQDAAFGRDVTNPSDADGRAGFQLVKISADYTRLPPDAASWSCVLDEVTGLVWEVKTDDGGLRDVGLRYSNFSDGRRGDASSFVAAVNAQTLCSQSDWRLPTRGELQSIMDYGRDKGTPTVDTRWFGRTAATPTWTSTEYVGGTAASWELDFSAGHVYFAKHKELNAVRLVRGGRPVSTGVYSALGSEVADLGTGLIWSRCSEGQTWNGDTCTGAALGFTWQKAVDRSKEVAASTGVAWRLPNPKELASLVDAQRVSPPIDATAFPATPVTWYWTSAFDTGGSKTAFFVNFQHGGVYDHARSRKYAVRLVRDAP